MQENTSSAAGVQDLIERIRDQGVQAAQDEAQRVLENAQRQAAEIVSGAKAEAETIQAKAREEIDRHRAASMDALQLASRDTMLDLKARIIARFEEFVRRLVVSATRDEELVRSIVLVLAGHAAEEFIRDKRIEVGISQSLLTGSGELKEEGRQAILGLSSDMLREGIELISNDEIEGGARVRLVDDQLEIDLSDRAVAKLISQRLVPRFKSVLEGTH